MMALQRPVIPVMKVTAVEIALNVLVWNCWVSLREKSYFYHPVPLHLSNNALIAQCGCLVKFELTHCRHLNSWFCWTVRGVKSLETLWWFYIEGVIIFFIGVFFVNRKRGIEVDKYISVNCFVKIWIWKIWLLSIYVSQPYFDSSEFSVSVFRSRADSPNRAGITGLNNVLGLWGTFDHCPAPK